MVTRRSVRLDSSVRRDVALAVIGLVGVAGVGAMFLPNGMVVLDKLLPVMTFILGYFFQK